MEKTEFKISVETERLEALVFFLQKEKASSLQKELGKKLEELYEETVPFDVRAYIDGRLKKTATNKPKVKPPSKTTGNHAERAEQKN